MNENWVSLDINEAIQMSKNYKGRLWEYSCSLSRLAFMLFSDDDPDLEPIYFLCLRTEEMNLKIHYDQINLNIVDSGNHIRFEINSTDYIICHRVNAVKTNGEWLELDKI